MKVYWTGGLMSKIYEGYAARQEKGLTNLYPQGKQEQTIGFIEMDSKMPKESR